MTYRDDLQAARMRRAALARELRDVRSRMDGYRELARQEEALEREISRTAQDIEQARVRVELPLLAQVRVASPCKERWSDMRGDDHVRFCGRCEKNVYDLSSLTAAQAEALLRERGESMCVRFFQRSDGTILTSDCPVGARQQSVRRRVAGAAMAAGMMAAGMALAGATADEQVDATAEAPVSGEMSPSGWTSGERVEPPVRPAVREPREQGRYFMGGTVASRDPRDALKERITDARTRLAAAKTRNERKAIRQELKEMRARARELEAQYREANRIYCFLSARGC